jgi:hypothetical protein
MPSSTQTITITLPISTVYSYSAKTTNPGAARRQKTDGYDSSRRATNTHIQFFKVFVQKYVVRFLALTDSLLLSFALILNEILRVFHCHSKQILETYIKIAYDGWKDERRDE